MTKALEQILAALEIMGKRYIREFILGEGWDSSRLISDWYYSFKFFLSKIYFQGRNDSLSDRYLKNMKTCLDRYFLPNPTDILETLWRNHYIPHDPEWKNFSTDNSLLWQQFDGQMGKRRDREMVMDVLRYIYSIPDHNILNHSIREIEARRIREHRNEIMELWGIGPKTSAFYLRDVIFLFNCELIPEEARELQPIDTWVRQVVDSLRDSQTDDHLSTEEWLVRHGGAARNSALLNAGMWYLGKHSFDLVLKLLTIGTISPEKIEQMFDMDT